MRLTTITNDANVGALADRLYANLTPESRKTAEAALLAANPHLVGKGGFKAGAVVRVPAVSGVRARAAAAGPDPVGDVLKELVSAVADYRKQLDESVEAAKKSVAEQAALLKSRGVKAVVDKSPEAKALASDLTASLSARSKALIEFEKKTPAVFTALVKDLETLAGRDD
jgi:hypothetical protein